MPFFFWHFCQPPGFVVKRFQIPMVQLEQALEAGNEIIVRRNGIELGVVDRARKPAIVIGCATPIVFQMNIFLFQ